MAKALGFAITELWAWVSVEDDGDEGLIAIGGGPDGMMLPLIGADARRVKQLRPEAEKIARRNGKPVVLKHFTSMEIVDTINP